MKSSSEVLVSKKISRVIDVSYKEGKFIIADIDDILLRHTAGEVIEVNIITDDIPIISSNEAVLKGMASEVLLSYDEDLSSIQIKFVSHKDYARNIIDAFVKLENDINSHKQAVASAAGSYSGRARKAVEIDSECRVGLRYENGKLPITSLPAIKSSNKLDFTIDFAPGTTKEEEDIICRKFRACGYKNVAHAGSIVCFSKDMKFGKSHFLDALNNIVKSEIAAEAATIVSPARAGAGSAAAVAKKKTVLSPPSGAKNVRAEVVAESSYEKSAHVSDGAMAVDAYKCVEDAHDAIWAGTDLPAEAASSLPTRVVNERKRRKTVVEYDAHAGAGVAVALGKEGTSSPLTASSMSMAASGKESPAVHSSRSVRGAPKSITTALYGRVPKKSDKSGIDFAVGIDEAADSAYIKAAAEVASRAKSAVGSKRKGRPLAASGAGYARNPDDDDAKSGAVRSSAAAAAESDSGSSAVAETSGDDWSSLVKDAVSKHPYLKDSYLPSFEEIAAQITTADNFYIVATKWARKVAVKSHYAPSEVPLSSLEAAKSWVNISANHWVTKVITKAATDPSQFPKGYLAKKTIKEANLLASNWLSAMTAPSLAESAPFAAEAASSVSSSSAFSIHSSSAPRSSIPDPGVASAAAAGAGYGAAAVAKPALSIWADISATVVSRFPYLQARADVQTPSFEEIEAEVQASPYPSVALNYWADRVVLESGRIHPSLAIANNWKNIADKDYNCLNIMKVSRGDHRVSSRSLTESIQPADKLATSWIDNMIRIRSATPIYAAAVSAASSVAQTPSFEGMAVAAQASPSPFMIINDWVNRIILDFRSGSMYQSQLVIAKNWQLTSENLQACRNVKKPLKISEACLASSTILANDFARNWINNMSEIRSAAHAPSAEATSGLAPSHGSSGSAAVAAQASAFLSWVDRVAASLAASRAGVSAEGDRSFTGALGSQVGSGRPR